jgi:hypothetical protein
VALTESDIPEPGNLLVYSYQPGNIWIEATNTTHSAMLPRSKLPVGRLGDIRPKVAVVVISVSFSQLRQGAGNYEIKSYRAMTDRGLLVVNNATYIWVENLSREHADS